MSAQDCKKQAFATRAALPSGWSTLVNMNAWLVPSLRACLQKMARLWLYGSVRKLPLLLVSEQGESSLNCLLMVAAYHDASLDVQAVRRRLGPAGRNMRLAELVQVAGTLGLRGRPLRVELSDLHRLPMPAILQWKQGECVVVRRCKAQQLWLHDPQSGACVVDAAEAAECFTGVTVILEREAHAGV